MPIYKVKGDKKDGYQKYRVVVNYTDADGKKRTVDRLVYGKDAAREKESELLDEVKSGATKTEIAAKPLTVEGFWPVYEKGRGPELRSSTLAKKKTVMKHHVFPQIGKIPLSKLTKGDIEGWKEALNRTGLKVTMKNNARRDLSAYLNFAMERGYIRQNPVREVKGFRDPYRVSDAQKLRYYTMDEWKRFETAAVAAAEKDGSLRAWGICLFFRIAYYTGMRKGEINGLRWTDIEDGRFIWVRRSVYQKIKGEPYVITPPKTASSERRLQMPKPLVDAINEHKDRQKKAEGWTEELFICGGPAPIPDTVLENANTAFGKAAGLRHITIHEFRHSHASLLCNAGVNIKEIARRLGHSDVEMTLKIYSHLYPKEEELAVSVLDKI